MHKYIVHVRVHCACTSILCVYEYIVRVRVHCACTSTLCVYEYIVHVRVHCVCTSTLCVYEYIVSACHETRTVVAMLQLAGRYLQMQEEIQMLTQKK